MKADWFFCFARFIIAKGQEKWSFSQVHYQQTSCWNNVQMYLKYGSEMLHFYKTNVAYLQVLLICRGKRPHRHRKILKISVTETKFNPLEFVYL